MTLVADESETKPWGSIAHWGQFSGNRIRKLVMSQAVA